MLTVIKKYLFNNIATAAWAAWAGVDGLHCSADGHAVISEIPSREGICPPSPAKWLTLALDWVCRTTTAILADNNRKVYTQI